MIRKIVVTSLLVVCALSAAAQRPRARIEWGVLGGINIPDYTTNMSGTDVKNKLGWQAGITTAVNLGAFAVEPQILYVRQGLRIRPEGQKEINLKSNSIDVPVLLSFRLHGGCGRQAAGPSAGGPALQRPVQKQEGRGASRRRQARQTPHV